MKRVMVALMVLLMAGLIVTTGAFSMPSALSGLNLPGIGSSSPGQSVPASSMGGFSTPASGLGQNVPSSNLQVSTPQQDAFSNWNLNNMQFFSPSNRASAQPASSIPASDINSMVQMLSQLPTSDQMSQYYGGGSGSAAAATPTPSPAETFTSNVSSEIPADQVIFVEVSRNTIPVDPTTQGIIVPNVSMNYKFSDKSKQLSLKRKSGVDINNTKILFGFSDSDDVNNRYVFDYGLESCPGMDVPVVFSGADGRVSVMFRGERKDLMPGQKAEVVTTEGDVRLTLTVTNWGLVPKANIKVADTI